MKCSPGFLLAVLLLALLGIAIFSSTGWAIDSRIFVLSCAAPAMLFLAIFAIRELLSGSKMNVKGSLSSGEIGFFTWISAYMVSIWLIGFQISSVLFVFSYVRFQGRQSLKVSAGLAMAVLTVVTGIFTQLLHIPWPDSVIGTWLF